MMNLSISTVMLDAMTVAIAMSEKEEDAKSLLEVFLHENNCVNAPRYFSELSIKRGNDRRSASMQFAIVPAHLTDKRPVNVSHVPASYALSFSVPKSELSNLADGTYQSQIQDYLKLNGIRSDIFPLMLGKLVDGEQIEVLMPFKKR